MLTTRYRTEEIFSQLRQAEVELSRGWWRGSARWRPSMGGMAIGGSRGCCGWRMARASVVGPNSAITCGPMTSWLSSA